MGPYDRTLPLVIDPTLTFSVYLGGAWIDKGWGVAVDAGGNVSGRRQTLSPNLPTTTNAVRKRYQGGNYLFGDGFVAKFANGSTNLSYLTYLGGNGEDAAFAIAVDPPAQPMSPATQTRRISPCSPRTSINITSGAST